MSVASDLDALLKDVEALDKAATPGPWRFAKHGGAVPGSEDDHPVVEFCEWARKGRKRVPAGDFGGIHIDEFRSVEGDDDATGELVAHYRTAAPRLAAMLRVAVEALDDARSYLMGRANHETDYEGDMDAQDRAKAAIARIEAMAKGEA